VIRRKAELVAAVHGGRWSLEGTCERYASTIDEFLSWLTTLDPHGLPGHFRFKQAGKTRRCNFTSYDILYSDSTGKPLTTQHG
jgi:hypothetical protein